MPAADLTELVNGYMDQNKLYRLEGHRGVETLCQLARAIGYRDPQNFGRLSSGAAIGDLISFFEDNSGAIEAVIEWIGNTNNPEFTQQLAQQVHVEEDEDDEEDEEKQQPGT